MSAVLGDPSILAKNDKRAQLAKLLAEKKHRTAPLSSAQQRLWFLTQLDPGAFAYNICGALRLQGPLKLPALERSLDELVQRHETLRTSIAAVDGTPVQLISAHARPVFSLVDLRSGDTNLELRINQEMRTPFELNRGPFFRANLFKRSETEHVLLLVTHHIVSDGWSIGVLRKELTALYEAFSRNLPNPLLDLPIQYSDYARWEEGWLQTSEFKKQLDFWKKKLSGAPAAIDLPLDKPRPPIQTSAGSSLKIDLGPRTSSAIRNLCQSESVTPFMLLLAAFHVLLSRYSGQEDILVGTPVAGRSTPETEGLIGILVNTVVIRATVGADMSFIDLLHRVKESCLEALTHQEAPFERIVEELHPQRDLSRSPIFQAMFILQVPMAEMRMNDLSIEDFALDPGVSRFELTLFFQDVADRFQGSFEYNTDLYERETIERMKGHYEQLLDGILKNPEQRIGTLDLLREQEKNQILLDWNATTREYPGSPCTHERIEQQAALQPDTVAVVFGQQRLTYADLNRRANQLARLLQRMGVGREDLVGICVDRSADMVVALLGTWKAGAAYLPVDPSYPDERVRFMLEDSRAKVLITEETLRPRWNQFDGQLLSLDGDRPALTRESTENFPSTAGPDNLAYVIYTSGSTGKPKGVMISHGALRNFLESMREQPGMQPTDKLLAVTTLCFDIAGLELYLPLVSGATVEIASREAAMDGQRLAALIQHSGATVMQATPVTWRMLLESGWTGNPKLKILCGGEALPRELAGQLFPLVQELWNMYGPTESTIWSTLWRVEAGSGPMLIGRPIANTTVYILDSHGHPVPAGVAGELHIGGAGLARGYFHRPELTAEKFIPNPIPGFSTERIYRTGDLARFRSDGLIECLGRLDQQVKLRGHRIELGEIETVLRQQEDVRNAVVVARPGPGGELALVAYAEGGPDLPSADQLRVRLRKQLPDYMIPTAIAVLDRLPLTNNGKVNRSALPAIEVQTSTPDCSYTAPRSETERQLVEIWEEILDRKPVGTRENFFDLGGHSLLVARLFTRIEKVTGHHLPVATLFQSSTVEDLARVIDGGDWQSGWASVVSLNKGASAPFFCIHSLGVNLISYKRLASLLGEEYPFYGLQPQGLDGREQPKTSLVEMAAEYLKDIRAIQPTGPYMLGGVCMGGVVAFEMAQQLTTAGEEVSVLLAIDSELPGPVKYIHSRPYDLMLLDWHLGMLFLLSFREKIQYLTRKALALVKRVLRTVIPREAEGSLARSIGLLAKAHMDALLSYRPKPYSGRMILLWTSEIPIRAYEDRRLAWSEVLPNGLEVHVIPGDHSTMIEEPHVHVLADAVKRILSRERSKT